MRGGTAIPAARGTTAAGDGAVVADVVAGVVAEDEALGPVPLIGTVGTAPLANLSCMPRGCNSGISGRTWTVAPAAAGRGTLTVGTGVSVDGLIGFMGTFGAMTPGPAITRGPTTLGNLLSTDFAVALSMSPDAGAFPVKNPEPIEDTPALAAAVGVNSTPEVTAVPLGGTIGGQRNAGSCSSTSAASCMAASAAVCTTSLA